MKNLFLYLLLFLVPATLRAQNSQSGSKDLIGFSSVNDAAKVAREIVEVSGRRANFAIAEADVQNAVAVLQQGKRYILYNPRFMNAITRATGTKWAAISVLAHEIGHHLYGKPGSNGVPKMATELEADEFSGYVLEKMGATLQEAQAAMSFLGSSQASLTHPARADRVRSIAKGWKNAGGIEEEEEVEETAPVYTRSVERATTSETAIASIYFTASPDGKYVVTKEMKVVSIGQSQTRTIGRVAKSDSERYPYVIYDDSGYSLYVHHSGSIVNKSGKVVGKMRAFS